MADITSLILTKADGNEEVIFQGGEKVCLMISANAYVDMSNPILGFHFKDRLGQDLFGENTLPFTAAHQRTVKAGQNFTAQFEFKLPLLPNGQYAIMASVADGVMNNNIQHHCVYDALIVNVSSSQIRWGLVGIPFTKVSLDIE